MIQEIAKSSTDAGAQGEGQAELAGQRLLGGRQPAADDGDEDEVVHAEHDLERGQRHQREEPVGGKEGVHEAGVLSQT